MNNPFVAEKIAFLFPGQGSQTVGMGRALAEADEEIAALFRRADEVLGYGLTDIMFNGPQETLQLTENTQPALVATAMGVLHLIRKNTDVSPDFVAGHSLGEYAAICAAGGFPFEDAVRLVKLRGRAMQEAVPVGQGAMAAMLNISVEDVEACCREASESLDQVCVPANYNTPGQIVISGHKEAVEKAVEIAGKKGSGRCIMLPVSAPFHCPLMQPAADRMKAALEETTIEDLAVPLVANVTADVVTEGDTIRELLVEQVTGAVRWEDSIRRMLDLGVDTFLEVGTGKVLTGMMRRIDRKVRAIAVNGPEDLDKVKNL